MSKAKLMLIFAVAAVFAVGVILGTPYQTRSGSDSDTLSDGEVAQLLRLIGVDTTGKITKQQWMDFTAAEFDRLDTNKNGVLGRAELSRSRLRVSAFVFPTRQRHTGMR